MLEGGPDGEAFLLPYMST